LPAVPDHGLACGQAEQGKHRNLRIRPVAEGFGERRLGTLALVLHLLEQRRFGKLQPDPDRDAEQHDREQVRIAPAAREAGIGKLRRGHRVAHEVYDQQ